MQRRQFIQAIGLAGSGLFPVGQSAWAALSPQPASQRKLIVVLLRGAVDGLNVVIPYQDPDYYRLRPAIARSRCFSARAQAAASSARRPASISSSPSFTCNTTPVSMMSCVVAP